MKHKLQLKHKFLFALIVTGLSFIFCLIINTGYTSIDFNVVKFNKERYTTSVYVLQQINQDNFLLVKEFSDDYNKVDLQYNFNKGKSITLTKDNGEWLYSNVTDSSKTLPKYKIFILENIWLVIFLGVSTFVLLSCTIIALINP